MLRLAARIGIVELMRSGTTVADHHYIYYPGIGYDPSAVLFDEADKLGVRFMLLRGGATQTRATPSRRAGAPAARDAGRHAGRVGRTVQRHHQRAGRAPAAAWPWRRPR